jgi:hypothetical protein
MMRISNMCVCMHGTIKDKSFIILMYYGMGKWPATMVGELPLVSSVEQDKWCTLHNRQPWSPFPYMIIFGEWSWHAMKCLWEGHGNMGTWEQGNYHWFTSLYHSPPSIYLWRKVVCCFVCTYEIHWTGVLQIVFLVSLESSQQGGCIISLVSWHLDLRV